MIEVIDIHKQFGEQKVLKGISSVFEDGKCNLVIGKSGSGKTVLIKTMVGLVEPDSGDVKYDGRSFTQMNKKDRTILRREIGMLFQGSALFDSMTVEENIRFPLDMFTDMTEAEKVGASEFLFSSCKHAEYQQKIS
jgi:phospholipid/cholesterol/gamma-HCH transport system ATP-binding protein